MSELKRGAEVTDDQGHHPTILGVVPLERLQARGYSQRSPYFALPLPFNFYGEFIFISLLK